MTKYHYQTGDALAAVGARAAVALAAPPRLGQILPPAAVDRAGLPDGGNRRAICGRHPQLALLVLFVLALPFEIERFTCM